MLTARPALLDYLVPESDGFAGGHVMLAHQMNEILGSSRVCPCSMKLKDDNDIIAKEIKMAIDGLAERRDLNRSASIDGTSMRVGATGCISNIELVYQRC